MKTYTAKEIEKLAYKFRDEGDENLAAVIMALSTTRVIDEHLQISTTEEHLFAIISNYLHNCNKSLEYAVAYIDYLENGGKNNA
jgi:hypothetical protein